MCQTPPLDVKVEPRSTFIVLRLRATSHPPSLISREMVPTETSYSKSLSLKRFQEICMYTGLQELHKQKS